MPLQEGLSELYNSRYMLPVNNNLEARVPRNIPFAGGQKCLSGPSSDFGSSMA